VKAISLYEIVKEIEIESNGSKGEVPSDEISKKSSDYSKKFKEILNGLHIDPAYFIKPKPSVGYTIPVDAKDAVKKLLLLYTSKPMKQVRKSNFEHLTFQEMREIVECIKKLLCCTLQGEVLLTELNKLEVLTQYTVKEAYSHMWEVGLDSLVEDTKSMLTPSFEHMLNHGDRVELMKYYSLEISQLNKRVQEIINIVNDMREDEIIQISHHEHEQHEKEEADGRFEIHEQIVKYLLKESKSKSKSKEYFENLNEIGFLTGLENEEEVLKELKKLVQNKNEKAKLKLVKSEDSDFAEHYRCSNEVVYEAIRKYYKETE
jgi:hypothetical protein